MLILLSYTFVYPCYAKKDHEQWDKFYEQGEKYFDKGDLKKSALLYTKSLKTTDSTHLAKSFYRLAEIYSRTDKPKDAEFCFRNALKFKASAEIYKSYAEFLRSRNRIAEAHKMEVSGAALNESETFFFPAELKEPKR